MVVAWFEGAKWRINNELDASNLGNKCNIGDSY